MTAICALLINQVLFGPLSHLPLETISTCSGEVCVVYWVDEDKCEQVDTKMGEVK